MTFNPPPPRETAPQSPEQLFAQLPRTSESVPSLWLHQGDILRTYVKDHPATRDLAIELPTGTGKTLPGLLVADWNRRVKRGRTVYACPTVQLVRQVVRFARKQGIPVVDLSGRSREWSQDDRLKFEGARATAVVTYSAIFNTSPKLSDVDVLLFDDAHAGEQYVAGAYSLDVFRSHKSGLYPLLLAALEVEIGTGLTHRLQQDNPDLPTRNSVRMVLPGRADGLVDLLDGVIHGAVADSDLAWSYASIRGHLQACAIYVKWGSILIRPFIPPTFENATFTDARQRIYLSATLGETGELERAFGRPKIRRLPLPESAGTPRSGRRFLVFPTLVNDADRDDITKELIARSGKAIVITPSNNQATWASENLVPNGWRVFGKDEVEQSFDTFARTDNSVCVLANRYDGLDLLNDACRAVVLSGHPAVTHLQEEFLSSRAKATAAISERVRSRVIQGTGRATRGPKDWALVIIADEEMTRYLARPEVQATMDLDLQAEISFGLNNAEVTREQLLQNVDVFLAQGTEWQENAEPIMSAYQAQAERISTPASAALAAAVAHEVEASHLAWQSQWRAASTEAGQAAEAMVGEHDIQGYRAFWLFLAGYLLNVEAPQTGVQNLFGTANGLVAQAIAAAQPATWIRELLPLPGLGTVELADHDAIAVEALSQRIAKGIKVSHHNELVDSIKAGLASTNPADYEPALSSLGSLLGAEAYKPPGDGNCDSAWCWDNKMWIGIEAKSDESPTGVIPLQDIRQVNSQLDLLAANRGGVSVPSGHAASVIVSPRKSVAPRGVAAAKRNLYLTRPQDFLALADDVEDVWKSLILLRHNDDIDQILTAVKSILAEAQLLPSDIYQRLTLESIAVR